MSKLEQDFSSCAGTATTQMQSAMEAAQNARALNALAYVDWQEALAQAKLSDQQAVVKREQGIALGALHGVPVSVKDLFQVNGMPMSAGTRAALPDLGGEQALAVSRLQAAGAIVFAKTNMHEIALGATGENAWTGDVCNPYDSAYQSGGSSSGAAVAIASGIGKLALGSDTGGSVRIPAAFCGVVGFKPSFGRIPLEGALHLSWTCDHAGVITQSVGQAKIAYETLAALTPSGGGHRLVHGLRIGLLPTWESARLSDALALDFASVLACLREAGVQMQSLELQASLKTAWDVYSTIVRAEAAWVHRSVLSDSVAAEQGFSATVLAPLRAGLALPAQDYLDAMRRREQAREQMQAALEEVDVIITPTSAVYPPLRGQDTVSLSAERMLSVREAVLGQTLPFSLFGLPALSLPYHKTVASRGFALGLQIVGRAGSDADVLAVGQALETLLV